MERFTRAFALSCLLVAIAAPAVARGEDALRWPAPSVARVSERITLDGAPAWSMESVLRVSEAAPRDPRSLRVDLGNARYVAVAGVAPADGMERSGTWATQPKWRIATADGALRDPGVWPAMARWTAIWDANGIDMQSPARRGMFAHHLHLARADSEDRWREFAGLWAASLPVGGITARDLRVPDLGGMLPVSATVERLPDDGGREHLRARHAFTASFVLSALAMGPEAWTAIGRARPDHWLLTTAMFPVRVEVASEAWLDPDTRRPLALRATRTLEAVVDGKPRRTVVERQFRFEWRDGVQSFEVASADDRPFLEHAEPPVQDGRRDPAYRLTRMPDYPPALHRSGAGGQVVLRARVAIDGRPLDVEVVGSSGHPDLDAAGIATLREWRFWPEVKDGQPIEAQVTVPLDFRPQVPPGR